MLLKFVSYYYHPAAARRTNRIIATTTAAASVYRSRSHGYWASIVTTITTTSHT
jgi:hypothetical protein